MGKLLYLSRADVERLLDVDSMLEALGKALEKAIATATVRLPRGAMALVSARHENFYWEGFPESGRNAYVTLRYAF